MQACERNLKHVAVTDNYSCSCPSIPAPRWESHVHSSLYGYGCTYSHDTGCLCVPVLHWQPKLWIPLLFYDWLHSHPYHKAIMFISCLLVLFEESKTKNSCYTSRHSLGLMLRTPNSLTPLCCRTGQNMVFQCFLDNPIASADSAPSEEQCGWEEFAVTQFKCRNLLSSLKMTE